MKGEDEREKVVRHGLNKAINGVESMGSKWSGNDPFVVRLVEALIKKWVVKTSMGNIDTKICKEDKKREL